MTQSFPWLPVGMPAQTGRSNPAATFATPILPWPGSAVIARKPNEIAIFEIMAGA